MAAAPSNYCFDTDVLSSLLRSAPSLDVIRRIATVPAEAQFTTSITLGELLYGAAKRRSVALASRIMQLLRGAVTILPFDAGAARAYASLRSHLEGEGRPLDEPDLRIASIALDRDLTLVTGNVRHFSRVPELRVEDWLNP